MPPSMTRRDFLRCAGAGTAGLLLPAGCVSVPPGPGSGAAPDLALELVAEPARISLRPGPPTPVWTYRARVLHGDPASVQPLTGSFLGPTIRVRRGQRVRVDFLNRLPQPSLVHWHGLHVPERMDGHPRYTIDPGERFRYEFTVRERAGTYWYHSHAHGFTAEQVYFGQAGLFIVGDEEEDRLGLPAGAQDLPVVLQDRSWGEDNRFSYLPGTGPDAARVDTATLSRHSHDPALRDTHLMGFFGDSILVNGQPEARLEVGTGPCRLRILNGSNARIYKLAWEDGRPLVVIGTDGGLLERPTEKGYVTLAPAERIDVWADFSEAAPGDELRLVSLPFFGANDRQGNPYLPEGSLFPLCTLRVTHHIDAPARLPERLSTITRLDPAQAVNRDEPKLFEATLNGPEWGINGRSFEMLEVAPEEIVRLGTTEIWEFSNTSIAMAHAMHLHGMQFQVLSRMNGSLSASVQDGYVEDGWKDTVLVMPGDRVKILVRFADYTGLFLYHCHMLEHADSGFMRNYLVKA